MLFNVSCNAPQVSSCPVSSQRSDGQGRMHPRHDIQHGQRDEAVKSLYCPPPPHLRVKKATERRGAWHPTQVWEGGPSCLLRVTLDVRINLIPNKAGFVLARPVSQSSEFRAGLRLAELRSLPRLGAAAGGLRRLLPLVFVARIIAEPDAYKQTSAGPQKIRAPPSVARRLPRRPWSGGHGSAGPGKRLWTLSFARTCPASLAVASGGQAGGETPCARGGAGFRLAGLRSAARLVAAAGTPA
jgi:hypothetical protein